MAVDEGVPVGSAGLGAAAAGTGETILDEGLNMEKSKNPYEYTSKASKPGHENQKSTKSDSSAKPAFLEGGLNLEEIPRTYTLAYSKARELVAALIGSFCLAKGSNALDSAARGNFLDKMPQEGLAIIESKSKVRYSRSRANDSRVTASLEDKRLSDEPTVESNESLVVTLLHVKALRFFTEQLPFQKPAGGEEVRDTHKAITSAHPCAPRSLPTPSPTTPGPYLLASRSTAVWLEKEVM
ncbi:hypothetical protein Tco_1351575 [Tanacetum coccineum]